MIPNCSVAVLLVACCGCVPALYIVQPIAASVNDNNNNKVAACIEVLSHMCGPATSNGQHNSTAGVLQCDACAGKHQAILKTAGCTATEVQGWCSTADDVADKCCLSLIHI